MTSNYFTLRQAEAILSAYSSNKDKKRSDAEVQEIRKKRFKSVSGFISKDQINNHEELRQKALESIAYHKAERAKKIKTGEVPSRYNPTKFNEKFIPVDNPEIGLKVHVSWAYKGAAFIIKRLEGDYAYLDNPKYKRKELLKVLIKDLRHTANRSAKIRLGSI